MEYECIAGLPDVPSSELGANKLYGLQDILVSRSQEL